MFKHLFQSRSIPDEIAALNPTADHLKIVQWVGEYEFPFETQRSLEFALFRTFAVPSISAVLAASGQFTTDGQRRYDDTALIIAEIAEHGYDSERGRAAIQRMNRIHRHFSITNHDYLYVLSTFVFEPSRFGRLLSWREATYNEKLANFTFWSEIGRRMHIRDIPDTMEAFEQFNLAYERDHFRYAETNREVAEASMRVFLAWFPALLHPLMRQSIYALMDDHLLEAVGFPTPSRGWRWLVRKSLRLRAAVVKRLPRQRKPFLLTQTQIRSYPKGYSVDELGPDGM